MVLLLCSGSAFGQQLPSNPPKQDQPKIQDNSFLIEEAYNQEAGVVQHINSFIRMRSGDWLYTFTQEWPLFGQKHQLSFTLPAARVSDVFGSHAGIGDVALNYRYQLVGNGETRVAVAPRFTLLAPTGDSKRGLGSGAVGVQLSLPASVVLSDKFVTHWNAGTTITPSAKNARGEKATTTEYSLGQSIIWLAAPAFNVMLETVWNSSQSVIGSRRTERSSSLLMSPGVRWAHNFKSGLQIVPGIAVSIGAGPSKGERSIFLYLSFEHPFKKR